MYKIKGVSILDNKLVCDETNEKLVRYNKETDTYILPHFDIYAWSCCTSTGYYDKNGVELYGGDTCKVNIGGTIQNMHIGYNLFTYEPQLIPLKMNETYGYTCFDLENIFPLSTIPSDSIEFVEPEWTPERISRKMDIMSKHCC